jgi:hypothetical protein
MDAETHPDPVREALNHGMQRAVQVGSAVMTGARVYAHHRRAQARVVAERDERARRSLQAQIRADREAARSGWAPALDRQWLRQADLPATARAWGAAMPYANRNVPWYEPSAATAMRAAEERLRDLHPYAMARYQRLRDDGLGPTEAMRQAAPLFARHPHARDAPFTPRPAFEAGTGAAEWVADDAGTDGGAGDLADAAALEQRGQRIVAALQERARADGREALGQEELRIVLDSLTNLPGGLIDRLSGPAGGDGQARPGLGSAAAAGRSRAADLDGATDRTATPGLDERGASLTAARGAGATAATTTAPARRTARPWEHDFPASIHDVVAAAAAPPAAPAAPGPAAARPAPGRAARPAGPGHGR